MKAIQEKNKPLMALREVLVTLVVMMMITPLHAQVRIGQDAAPTQGAVLDLSSTSAGYIGGLKLPNVVITNLNAIPTGGATGFKEVPADLTTLAGTQVFNTTASTGIPAGVYYWTGTKWVSAWLTTGNAGTDAASNFLGTTDAQSLMFRVNNIHGGHISEGVGGSTSLGRLAGANSIYTSDNVAIGDNALATNSSGTYNTAIGNRALAQYTGSYSTAVGTEALKSNTTGGHNTAVGVWALSNDVNGNGNTAVGFISMMGDMGASQNNTAIGAFSMQSGSGGGSGNVAVGSSTLSSLAGGSYNLAVGNTTGNFVTTGSRNIAIGYDAHAGTTGDYNIVIGAKSCSAGRSGGSSNTAIGTYATHAGTTGDHNLAIGHYSFAGKEGSNNTAVGYVAQCGGETGSNNTAIGYKAITGDGDNQVSIQNVIYATGATGVATIGNVGIGTSSPSTKLHVKAENYVAGTYKTAFRLEDGSEKTGYVLTCVDDFGTAYWSDPTGISSDRRLKANITPSKYGLSEIMKLQPVNYELKSDPGVEHVGFIAQEVQTVIPEVVRGTEGNLDKGETLSIAYAELTPVLAKAIQEQQAEIESLRNLVEAQQKLIEQLEARLKVLEAAK